MKRAPDLWDSAIIKHIYTLSRSHKKRTGSSRGINYMGDTLAGHT
ncbi:hypothetical protein ACFLXB_05095 [Chloroflexota bacterium]